MPRIDPPLANPHRSAFLIVWNGRARGFPINRLTLAGLAFGVPALLLTLLGAAAYFIFHDQLLAAMMTHQVEMQYSYEDRIAVLSTDLDRAAIRDNTERGALETRLRRLDETKDQLETRAEALDGLIARLRIGAAKQAVPVATVAPPGAEPSGHEVPLDSSGGLRLGRDTLPGERHVDLSSDEPTIARVAGTERAFDRLGRRQTRVLADLAGPTMRDVERMNTALAKTGLPIARWHIERDVGGPFVPLSPGMIGFEETVGLLRVATLRRDRLGAIVDAVPLRRPLARPLEVTSTFGPRLDPFFGRPAMHTGVDLREAEGEAVIATAAGVVTLAGSDGGYGNLVEIDHGNGVRTRYAHLGGIAVSADQKVAVGAIIGHVGSTGRATGPHLHYEVRIDGEPIDPARFLTAGADLFPG